MNIITKYIGKEVRRIVLAVRKKNDKYHNLFTMIERLNSGISAVIFNASCERL